MTPPIGQRDGLTITTSQHAIDILGGASSAPPFFFETHVNQINND